MSRDAKNQKVTTTIENVAIERAVTLVGNAMIGWTRTACCRGCRPALLCGGCGIPARRVCRPGRRHHPRGCRSEAAVALGGSMGGGVWAGGNHLCSCALSLGVRIVQPPRSPTAGRAVLAVVHRRPRRDGTGGKAGRSWAVRNEPLGQSWSWQCGASCAFVPAPAKRHCRGSNAPARRAVQLRAVSAADVENRRLQKS